LGASVALRASIAAGLGRLRASPHCAMMRSMLAALVVTNEFYVGWGTLALVNAGLAQGKGRSGLAWFLASLLLGPVATFVLVAFFDRRVGS